MAPSVVLSPAKINLFLRVIGKRSDGYHELETLMCCVDLFDTVTLSFGVPAIRVRCSHPEVPEGEENIAYRAAVRFFEALGTDERIDVYIDKRIPVAAGLGGGSSNAAAVLKGLNEHFGRPLRQERLLEIGLTLGADVPFFLFGRNAIARGIGERLEPAGKIPPAWVVLVHPRVRVSTKWVYDNLNLRLTNCEENYNVSSFLEDLSSVQDFLCNDLEQVTAQEFPEIGVIKQALLALGAKGALMSGSGPTVFGLFERHGQASAARKRLEQHRDYDTFLVRLLS
jgi:4-diphosphocytidyl-2-C-methyl-D-erythritol kinase